LKLVTASSGTSYTDTTPNASLGAAAPGTNTATAAQVAVSGIAIGPTGTTGRNLYRTVVNGAQLKLHTTIANNTGTTIATDTTVDGSLGANAPTSDTSGLTQPTGQILAGSTTIPTAGAAPFSAGGGVVLIGSQVVRYTGVSGNTLTGIPASGTGALVNSVRYGEHVDVAPALTGVTGIDVAIPKGTLVNLWVQRDDLAAQATQAAIDAANGITPADGVYEHVLSDERRGEASMIALCDAELALYSRPIATVTYACRDPKTKSGKTVHIDVTTPPIGPYDLTIQDVTISEIDIAPGTAPRFTVTASSVRFTLEALLRQALAGAGA